MNALLEHKWGQCAPADWVWSQVSSMRLAEAVLQPFMALQAFVDESFGDGLLVLGGALATAESWSAFSKDWEPLLALAPLGDDMKRNFKLSEMLDAGPARIRDIPVFGNVIDTHVTATLSVELHEADIEKAKSRLELVLGQQPIWGSATNPYVVAVTHLVAWCRNNREQIKNSLGTGDPIEFFFDERIAERKILRDAWDKTVETLPPEERSQFGSELRFGDDKKFLGLQAADYLAGWARYWIEKGKDPELGDIYFEGRQFEGLKVTGELKIHIVIKATVDSIADFLAEGIEVIEVEERK